jgi:hypothetical protein
MAYRVYALDHRHCHDKGVFATLDDAIAVCIQMNHEYQCFALHYISDHSVIVNQTSDDGPRIIVFLLVLINAQLSTRARV